MASARGARAADAADYYKGRTITIVVGFSPGGGFDTYGRFLARHLGKQIPGNPSVVVQNMPGAGSLTAALYLYKIAPKDGTVIATFGRTVPITPRMAPAQFDGRRFTWIGSITNEVSTCFVSAASKVQSWQDALTRPFTLGGEGADGDLDIMAQFVIHVFGVKARLIAGYPGSNDVGLAVLRGELDGVCGLSFSTARNKYKAELADKRLKVIVQATLQKGAALPNVPSLADFADPDQLELMKVVFGPQMMGRPFAAPPDIPEASKVALRSGFRRVMSDPDFLADAAKANLDVVPAFAEEIDAFLAEIYQKPPALFEKAKRAIVD